MDKRRVEQNADDDEDDAWLKELLFSHRADSWLKITFFDFYTHREILWILLINWS